MAEYFSLTINHGGKFVEGEHKRYVGGSVNHFDNVDPDRLCFWDLKEDVEGLGHHDVKKICFKYPGLSLDDGLRDITSDKDICQLCDLGMKHGSIEIFVEHGPLATIPPDVSTLQPEVSDAEKEVEDMQTSSSTEYSPHDDDQSDDDQSEDSFCSIGDFLSEDEEVGEARKKMKDRKKMKNVDTTEDEVVGEAELIVQSTCDTDYPDSSDFDTPDISDEDVQCSLEKKKKKFQVFNPKYDMQEVRFRLGMTFRDDKEFKDAVVQYSVLNKYDLKFTKSEKERVEAKCAATGCPFRIYASFDKRTESFQVKSFVEEHKCVRTHKNKQMNSTWLAKQFLEKFRSTPGWKVKEMREEVRRRHEVDVTMVQCWRAKKKALKMIHGSIGQHYARLWDYAHELISKNRGSSIILKVDRPVPGGPLVFQRMYVGFEALKKGWMEGCRPIIGLDGCFLKGICKGELLTAVGRDANDQMFPIAWAIVEVENKNSWTWFIQQLIDHMGISMGLGWTLISDQQKGLIQAIKDILPLAEHRQCARHIYANWKKVHKGKMLKFKFFKAVKCTTEGDFLQAMEEIRELSEDSYNNFMKQNPRTFVKAYLSTIPHCDVIDNNMSEAFNGYILEARGKPIIQMLEDIRRLLMGRVEEKARESNNWHGKICPRIEKKIDENKSESRNCDAIYAGQNKYEVRQKQDQFGVALAQRTCTCRLWDLTGIPCAHAVCAIWHRQDMVEDHVSEWYTKEFWQKCYAYPMSPIVGERQWPRTDNEAVQPPRVRVMLVRPKRNRVKDPFEDRKLPHKLNRIGRVMTCHICNQPGHNKKGCPSKDNPPAANPQPKRPRGRSRKETSGHDTVVEGQPKRPRGRPRKETSGHDTAVEGQRSTQRQLRRRAEKVPRGYGVYVSPKTGSTILMMPGQPSKYITESGLRRQARREQSEQHSSVGPSECSQARYQIGTQESTVSQDGV